MPATQRPRVARLRSLLRRLEVANQHCPLYLGTPATRKPCIAAVCAATPGLLPGLHLLG